MSYIAFDLDALNQAPAVARAAGVDENLVIAGLARMWAWCFRTKTDAISETHARGFFGADVVDALLTFDFLAESAGEGVYRVRGADRYLQVSKARSENGKKAAASGNLKRGKSRPAAGGGAGATFPNSAQPSPQCGPALPPTEPQQTPSPTPSTKHLTPSTIEKDVAGSEPPPPKEHQQIIVECCRIYETHLRAPYGFTPRDARHVKELRALAREPEEIYARWELALKKRDKWPKVMTLGALVSHWNEFPVAIGVMERRL